MFTQGGTKPYFQIFSYGEKTILPKEGMTQPPPPKYATAFTGESSNVELSSTLLYSLDDTTEDAASNQSHDPTVNLDSTLESRDI